MSKGKITIESGKYKTIFTLSNQGIHVEHKPALNNDTTEEANFVKNIGKILIFYLLGDEQNGSN